MVLTKKTTFMETNNGSNKSLTKKYIYDKNWWHRVRSLQMIAVTLTWSYFHITREPYLVSISQVEILISADKVDVIFNLVQFY